MLPIISNLILGGIVLHRNFQNKTFRLFFALTCLVTAWGLATLIYLDYQSLRWARVSFALGIWILTTAVFFARNYPAKQGLPRRWSSAILIGSVALSLASLSRSVLASFPPVVFGPLLGIYVAYFFILFGGIIYTFFKQHTRAHGHQRQVLLFVLLSCCLSILWGAVFSLIFPIVRNDIVYNRLGALAAPLLTLGIAYTIIRHRLFDIQLQTQRLVNVLVPVGIVVTLAVFAGLGLSRVGLLSASPWAAVLLAGSLLLYEALRLVFAKTWVGYVLFRSTYRFHRRLENLAASASSYTEIDDLATAIRQTFSAEGMVTGFGLLLVVNQAERSWVPHDVTTVDVRSVPAFGNQLHREFFEHLVATRAPVVVDELPYRRPRVSPTLQAGFAGLLGGVCAPLLVSSDMAGVLVLGPKRGGRAYTTEDVQVLTRLAMPLAVALTKAKLRSEERARTELLALEKANLEAGVGELLNLKHDFLTIIDHQFNTPLSVIRSAFAMVSEGDVPPEEVRAYLQTMAPRLDEFTAIVQTMLSAAHLEGSTVRMNFQPLDVNAVVSTVTAELQPLIAERQVTLSLDLALELPRVLSDPEQFTEAVRQLVKNAVIYGQYGPVSIKTLLGENGRVSLVIQDVGRGFDAAEAARIGQPFVRGSGTVDYLANGSGLGLYVAKRTIAASGGSLRWASPGPAAGATVVAELRRATDAVAEATVMTARSSKV